jgi:hypothetical protein
MEYFFKEAGSHLLLLKIVLCKARNCVKLKKGINIEKKRIVHIFAICKISGNSKAFNVKEG